MSFFFKHKKIHGFTLIELMVTLSIMIVILMTVSLNQNKYSAGISLKNTANTVGLYIRQAQTYGVSVRETSTGSLNFNNGYGVAFTTVGSGNNTKYIYFTDHNTPPNYTFDGVWTCSVGDPSCGEFVSAVTISNNNRISDLCVITTFNGTDTETCGLGRIDISFKRPKIDTNFVFFDSSLNNVTYSGVKGVKIKLASLQGDTRSVVVYITRASITLK